MKFGWMLFVLLIGFMGSSGCSGENDADKAPVNPSTLTKPELQNEDSLKQLKYYRADRLPRYVDYIEKNPDWDAQKAVIYVNADLDKPFYTDVKVVSQPEDILVLCNKYYRLPEDYEPKDLVSVGRGYFLRAEAAAAYREMVQTALQQNLSFQLRSAYRSYPYQQGIYNRYVARDRKSKADTYSARPGHSEHQTGLSFDITQPVSGGTLSSANFDKTPQFVWLSKHAHEYGFILRYPALKTHITGFVYEPWHYRYVGKEVAKRIYEQGLTFDEYTAMRPPSLLR
ncbi:MAG: M15 family metallopeptidase [Burkholderiales bacterium]|jgi:D-alanyl-D-alanine carboxypeptidase|nr:M15 family metallopeptidase [Burkholderiales bacterium]